jgi:hypothetical protein
VGLWSVYDRGWSAGTYLQVGKGPSSVFIPVLDPSRAQIWCRANDQICQLDIPGLFVFLFFSLATTLSGLLPVMSVIIKTGYRKMSEPGEFRYSLFLLPPKKEKQRHTKKQGVGACFIFDKLCITLVVSGPPFGGLVCLRKCRDNVDCSCESVGQSVYGPRISFLGHFNPFWCRTDSSITRSLVARSLHGVELTSFEPFHVGF